MLTKNEIELMSPDESIDLAIALWDHAHEAATSRSLTEEQKKELDRRLEYSLAHPGSARPWEQVMDELEAKHARI